MTTLITAVQERDYPGHVLTVPVARRLAARLLAADEPVRVLAPREVADGWPPGIEYVAGDIARPDATPEAFDDIERLFLAGALPDTAAEAVRMARRGGAGRIAVLSSHGPDVEIEFGPESWYWLAIEVVVERSGAAWTHLRPAPVMAQALRTETPGGTTDLTAVIRSGGAVPVHGADSEYPYLDEDDLAAIAAEVLTRDGYAGRALNVHGEPTSLRERIDLVGRALGRRIPLEELSSRQTADSARAAGVPDEEVDEWLAAEEAWQDQPEDEEYRQWVREGIDTVTRVIGRPPRGFADWAADHVEDFRP